MASWGSHSVVQWKSLGVELLLVTRHATWWSGTILHPALSRALTSGISCSRPTPSDLVPKRKTGSGCTSVSYWVELVVWTSYEGFVNIEQAARVSALNVKCVVNNDLYFGWEPKPITSAVRNIEGLTKEEKKETTKHVAYSLPSSEIQPTHSSSFSSVSVLTRKETFDEWTTEVLKQKSSSFQQLKRSELFSDARWWKKDTNSIHSCQYLCSCILIILYRMYMEHVHTFKSSLRPIWYDATSMWMF